MTQIETEGSENLMVQGIEPVTAEKAVTIDGNTSTLSQPQLNAVRRSVADGSWSVMPLTEGQFQRDLINASIYAQLHPETFLDTAKDACSNLFNGAGEFVSGVWRVGTYAEAQIASWVLDGGLKEALKGALTWCVNGGLTDFLKSIPGAIKEGLVAAGKWLSEGGLQKALGSAYDFFASGKVIDWISNPETWKSMVKGILSFTGLLQLYQCAQSLGKVNECLKNGDMKGAQANLMKAALEGVSGSIALAGTILTVVTVGSSLSLNAGLAAANVTVKEAVVESAGIIAKEASKEIVERTTQAIGTEVLEKIGAECAKGGLATFKAVFSKTLETTIERQIASHGMAAITEEFMRKAIQDALVHAMAEAGVREATKKVTEAAVMKMLREHGIQKIVEEETLKLLTRTAAEDVGVLTETLAKNGVSHAGLKARALKRALLDGSMDDEIKQVFEDRFTEDLTRSLQERGLRKGFEKGLEAEIQSIDDEAKAIAAKYGVRLKDGISCEMAEAIKAEARIGFNEGVDSAVRQVVREGIEEAFRKFREKREDNNSRSMEGRKERKEKRVEVKTRNSEVTQVRPGERPSIAAAKRQEEVRETVKGPDLAKVEAAVEKAKKTEGGARSSFLVNWDKGYKGVLAGETEKAAPEAVKLEEGLLEFPTKMSRSTAQQEIVSIKKDVTKAA